MELERGFWRSKKPTQNEILLYELANARERGVSSYQATWPNSSPRSLAERIWDLRQVEGILIVSEGTKEKRYFLKSITAEAAATVTRNTNLLELLGQFIKVDLEDIGKLTPIEQKVAEKRGEIIAVYEGNMVRFVPKGRKGGGA